MFTLSVVHTPNIVPPDNDPVITVNDDDGKDYYFVTDYVETGTSIL